MDRSLLKVHLANGGFKVFKCSDGTTVKVRRIHWNQRVLMFFRCQSVGGVVVASAYFITLQHVYAGCDYQTAESGLIAKR